MLLWPWAELAPCGQGQGEPCAAPVGLLHCCNGSVYVGGEGKGRVRDTWAQFPISATIASCTPLIPAFHLLWSLVAIAAEAV